jgi:enoyl-CoA hydratase/carnithine racemase
VAEVEYQLDGHVALMTMTRPEKMNALTPDGLQLQTEMLDQFRQDDNARVLVIAGTGRAFSTGMDLSQAKDFFGNPGLPPRKFGLAAVETWKPIIAAINGYALGGGLELALSCDIRIAASDAKIGLAEVKRALIPGAGGITRLVRQLSMGDALKLMLTGEHVSAEEALRIGLVQEVVEPDALLPRALELAAVIAANAPIAVQTVKEAAYRGQDMPLPLSLAQDQLFSLRNRQTADAAEGTKAFAEKRTPDYQGR